MYSLKVRENESYLVCERKVENNIIDLYEYVTAAGMKKREENRRIWRNAIRPKHMLIALGVLAVVNFPLAVCLLAGYGYFMFSL